ncbi:C4b-binding protein alpha chain isoform X2 [Megalops cyprinoides]|uniref:C4b-binding protein alpha chain isoform X2 n=1 Tax=Megalops cyprinoides TaxID=118141 RepID=UPI001863A520|nr:C4b-binding protein alpha chain isoform X2 [Megalops cyprinoides]
MPCFGDSCWRLSPQLLLLFLIFPVGGKAQCEKPTLPAGLGLSEESLSSDSFPDGSTAKLVCSLGYVRAGGSSDITCAAGQWSSPKLLCEKKSCGSPGEITHGRFDMDEGIDFGATVRAFCDEGYELVGPSYRQCFDFGWTNRVPLCEAVRCEGPPEIPNGRILNPPEAGFTLYRDVIEYACNKGYSPSGPLQVYCGAEKTYVPSPPSCTVVSCPVPNIPHAVRKEGPPPPYSPKNYVVYACDQGYDFEGDKEKKLVCLDSGSWSPSVPECKKIVVPTRSTTTTASTTATTTTTTTASAVPATEPPHSGTGLLSYGLGFGIPILLLMVAVAACCLMKEKKKGRKPANVDAEETEKL